MGAFNQHTSDINSYKLTPKKSIGKRKHSDSIDAHLNYNASFNPLGTSRTRMIKKNRNMNQIFGQKLSLSRLIETLDKEKLQNLVKNLINDNPELTDKIIESSPIITIDDALNELERKLDMILANIPYKVDITSDYSFLRVKTLVNDFFHSLSDYSLSFLPPVETDFTVSIKFLKRFLLEIFHNLPDFSAVEYKYYRNLTIEKFNLILENSITNYLNEKKQNLLLLINENWLDEFKQINELNNNSFMKIQLLLESEIDNYYNSGSLILNTEVSSAILDSDKVNKLEGLDNLLNFAYQNPPLNNV
ncbi:hypothetical protein CAS74_004199 [Pichia kudriavzevii]|uniref:Tethering factor for nuclear proteasome STS1 n=3 Tax=Pichia kudriavzevii TaxID=4909 RepID=A0A1Z8JIY4_PICKU|nr:uncharacterized protein C5L36_0A08240 [Pichia kudriavzevii]AWU74226.1 hypothetical protein C5L36_0A08240 [Pichia kudriavzevii]MDC6274428.1 hypothetical protein [Lacticaseibacillus paracasei]OUT20539.1 hypothetical protein CAS74_004199 [Pichia kudriavzevii]